MKSSLVTASHFLSGGTFAKLSYGQRTNSDMPHATSGLTRGAGMGRKLDNPSWTAGAFPLPQATLDIDFTNNRSYVKGASSGGLGNAFSFLSFGRASNATYFGADGLLKTTGFPQPYQVTTTAPIPPNYCPYSQTFTVGWGYNSVIPTDNVTTAPDSTLTGGKWVASLSGVTYHQIGPPANLITSFINGVGYQYYSMYVKAAEYNRIFFRTAAGTGATYDVSTGTIVQTGGGVTPSITAVGNGWYRCGFLFQSSTSPSPQIFMCRNTDAGLVQFAGDGVSGIFVWGFQIEDIANVNYRFDYQAPYTDYPKNDFPESENFGNTTYWTPSFVTVSTDGTLAPNGVTQASLLTVTADNQAHSIVTSTGGGWGAAPATFSIYAKIGTASRFRITPSNAVPIEFDLNTQQSNTFGNTNFFNITVEALANGWYRCSYVFLQAANNGLCRINIINSAGDITYVGSGQSMYFFGIQRERIANSTNNFPVGSYSSKRNLQSVNNSPIVISTKAGYRTEQGRANYVLWCRDFTQSNWTQTNITRTLNQIGIDGVVNSASSLTATAGNATIFQAITLGANYVGFSVFIKAITVTGNIQATLDNGTTWFDIQGLSTSVWNRVAVMTNITVTNPTVGLRIVNSGDSIAVDYAQLEVINAFDYDYTSPIYTSTSTATRAADVCTIPTTVWMNQLEGTISARYYATFGSLGPNFTSKQVCGTCSGTTASGSTIGAALSGLCAIQKAAGNNLGYSRVNSNNFLTNSTNNVAYAYRFDGTNRVATNNNLSAGQIVYSQAFATFVGKNEWIPSSEFSLTNAGNAAWGYYNQPTFFVGTGSAGQINGVIYRITYTPKFLSTEGTAQLTSNENIL